jgi:transglutaminase-like putative cysteine protease
MSLAVRRAFLVVAALALPVVAQGDGERVLHEYVPEDPSRSGSVIGAGEQGTNPAAIRVGGEVLPEPSDPAGAEPGEPTYGADDATIQRRHDTFRPDDQTHLDAQLRYTEAFNPAIAPFKRLSAMDAVQGDFILAVGRRSLEEVPVVGSGAESADRDLFWGSVVVDLAPGEAVPLPSVSPESRILSYRTTPTVPVRFYRDSADNFFATGNHRGAVRLVFLMDASAAYFGAELPDDRTPADIPAGRAWALPPAVAASAARVASELGVDRSQSLRTILSRLAGHFRAYQESDAPPTGRANLYENLALGGKGVCRHRAFAFMVTANALGIPTRFVMNEAHAFVESLLPDTGWLRIDLGGAAQGLTLQNAADRVLHQPRRGDELPQPQSYRDQYTQLRGQGLRGPAAAQGPMAGPGQTPTPSAAAPSPGAPSGAPRPVPQPGAPPAAGGAVDPTALPDRGGQPARTPTFTVVTPGDPRPRRGSPIRVAGQIVEVSGAPYARAHVQVFLSRDGRTPVRWLGTLVAGDDGRWGGEVLLPGDVEAGAYHVLAATPGDTTHDPSMSPR